MAASHDYDYDYEDPFDYEKSITRLEKKLRLLNGTSMTQKNDTETLCCNNKITQQKPQRLPQPRPRLLRMNDYDQVKETIKEYEEILAKTFAVVTEKESEIKRLKKLNNEMESEIERTKRFMERSKELITQAITEAEEYQRSVKQLTKENQEQKNTIDMLLSEPDNLRSELPQREWKARSAYVSSSYPDSRECAEKETYKH